MIVIILVVAAVGSVYAAWESERRRPKGPNQQLVFSPPRQYIDPSEVGRIPEDRVLAELPRTFLQTPLDASGFVWLIDAGEPMTEYYEDVTTLVASAMARLEHGLQKFGLYMVSGSRLESLPLSYANGATLRAAQDMMRGFHPEGQPDLSAAFAHIVDAGADTVFMLITQSSDLSITSAMSRQARDAGLTVSVGSIGEAKYGWARLTLATDGHFTWLPGDDLQLVVARMFTPPLGFELPDESASSLAEPTTAQPAQPHKPAPRSPRRSRSSDLKADKAVKR
ncbi:MAG: hypothetical protein V3T70_04065 [Phycisphaerae bacterium]